MEYSNTASSSPMPVVGMVVILSKCVEMVHGKREGRPESLGMTSYLTLAIVGRVQTVDCEGQASGGGSCHGVED